MDKTDVEDLKQRVMTFIRLYGVPINIRYGTDNDIAEWIGRVIDLQGKEKK